MDKSRLKEQMGARLRAAVQATHRSSEDARTEAKTGAPRAVNMAQAQTLRSVAAREALDALDEFFVRPLKKGEPIGLGTIVEVEDGEAGRTFFLAPVCGGEELEGPGGDGIFHVITPSSPFGRALMGKRVGATVEVMIAGEPTEWSITYAA